MLLALLLQFANAAHPFEACTLTVATRDRVEAAPFVVEFDEAGAITYHAAVGRVVARMYNNRGRLVDAARAPGAEPRMWFGKNESEYFTVFVSDNGAPVSGSGTPFDDSHRPIFEGRGVTTEEGAYELIRQHNPEMRLHESELERDAAGNMVPGVRTAYVDCPTPQY